MVFASSSASAATERIARLHRITKTLSKKLDQLVFAEPVTHVYNPLHYAWAPHAMYLEKYGSQAKEVLLMGMNPGPFGMAQTGVPFGEVAWVRDWLNIEATVKKPAHEHPKRPVTGFDCHRREVSGARLWGWAKEKFATPERFFNRFFVYNYCPLAFMEQSGRNRTPDKLLPQERKALFALCDAALAQVVETLEVPHVIGIGGFARKRLELALPCFKGRIGQMLHPSPASPLANAGWAKQASLDLQAAGIVMPR